MNKCFRLWGGFAGVLVKKAIVSLSSQAEKLITELFRRPLLTCNIFQSFTSDLTSHSADRKPELPPPWIWLKLHWGSRLHNLS